MLAVVLSYIFSVLWTKRAASAAQQERKRLLEDANKETERLKSESREETREWISEQREVYQKEVQEQRKEVKDSERRISKREDSLDRKMDLLNKKERQNENEQSNLKKREQGFTQRQDDLERLIDEEKSTLYRITEMSKDEAEKILLTRVESELEHEKDLMISRMVERVKETVEERSRDILATTVQRMASTYCQEVTVSSIELPNEEMKGRIIGREGRNIRSFEKATGVDVIVDDTPGVIVLSCFDSIRREMARRSIEQLISDGRIHPTRIEEVVAETKQEMNELIQRTGKEVSYELDIPGLNHKLITLLGRLRFRAS